MVFGDQRFRALNLRVDSNRTKWFISKDKDEETEMKTLHPLINHKQIDNIIEQSTKKISIAVPKLAVPSLRYTLTRNIPILKHYCGVGRVLCKILG